MYKGHSMDVDAVVSVHKFRRAARAQERALQDALERYAAEPTDWAARNVLTDAKVPDWAHGVRVEHAGPFQHAVVATRQRGR